MNEYKVKKLTKELRSELKKRSVEIVEQVFKKEKSFLLYTFDDLRSVLNEYGIDYELTDVASTGWETGWRDYLSDGWLTDTVYYCFDNKTFDDEREVIRINPALAFGTGGHATTRIAASLLEKTNPDGHIVMDIGTGSGILSVLASLKGAAKVYACDNDPVTLPNALENAALNGVSNIDFKTGDISVIAPGVKPYTVVANIITSVLTVIHPEVLKLTPEYIVYSGILRSEYDRFVCKIDLSGYDIFTVFEIDEWCGMILKRKPL